MRQAFITAIIAIILALIATFAFNYQNLNMDKSLSVSIFEDGEEIYSTPFSIDQIVWFIDYDNQELILNEDEVYDYFDIDFTINYDNLNPLIWDKIYAKTAKNAQINIVKIDESKVSMYEANCKDRVCVKMGSISKANQVITCAPHKFVVKIVGDGEFDA